MSMKILKTSALVLAAGATTLMVGMPDAEARRYRAGAVAASVATGATVGMLASRMAWGDPYAGYYGYAPRAVTGLPYHGAYDSWDYSPGLDVAGGFYGYSPRAVTAPALPYHGAYDTWDYSPGLDAAAGVTTGLGALVTAPFVGLGSALGGLGGYYGYGGGFAAPGWSGANYVYGPGWGRAYYGYGPGWRGYRAGWRGVRYGYAPGWRADRVRFARYGNYYGPGGWFDTFGYSRVGRMRDSIYGDRRRTSAREVRAQFAAVPMLPPPGITAARAAWQRTAFGCIRAIDIDGRWISCPTPGATAVASGAIGAAAAAAGGSGGGARAGAGSGGGGR